MRSRTSLVLGLAALVAALVVGIGWWQLESAASVPGPAGEQRVTVPPGASLRATLRQLEGAGLVRHPRLLELYLRCCRDDGRGTPAIKAGRYLFPAGSTPIAIVRQMEEGRVILEQLTLVEGWTFAQWRRAIEAHPEVEQTLRGRPDGEIVGAIGRDARIHPEGRFAPETYRFAAGTPDVELLRMAWDAQDRILRDAWEARAPDLPVATPDEALILASIVEKETGLASERARIAGVFTNRLRRGMRLQTDPTVIYGIEAYDGNIRRADLQRDTPYNTYTRAGLPPTPIAMPGRDAIWAALHPEPGDALYFVAIGDGTGGHYFSSTLDEHNRAVQRYLRRLRRGGE